MDPTKAVQTQPLGGVQTIPDDDFSDLIADAGRGAENISAKDVRPPVLRICQAGSPQRKTDNPKQIQGLQELDLFNTLSNEIYGRSVRFVVITFLGTHWVEFGDDLSVVDRDVPEGDPRTEWTKNDEGERIKPKATQFYDYLLWLPEHSEIVAFSFKSTQIKVAFKLNGLLKLPLKLDGGRVIVNPPAWARTFKLETKMEKDGTYEWGGFNLATDGITPAPVRAAISDMAKLYSDKNIVIERDDDANDVSGAAAGDSGTHAAGDDPGM